MTIQRLARTVAFLLLAALAAWAAYLVVVGVSYTVVSQVQPGQPLGPAQIVYEPYYPAFYSPLALLLVAIGLIRDRWLPLAWVGLLLHLAVGGLLIFSLGIVYIAATGLLAVFVGIIDWQASHQDRWLVAAGCGAAVVLLVGVLLRGTIYTVLLIAAGSVLAGLVIILWRWRPGRA
jgi:hypothetical protein